MAAGDALFKATSGFLGLATVATGLYLTASMVGAYLSATKGPVSSIGMMFSGMKYCSTSVTNCPVCGRHLQWTYRLQQVLSRQTHGRGYMLTPVHRPAPRLGPICNVYRCMDGGFCTNLTGTPGIMRWVMHSSSATSTVITGVKSKVRLHQRYTCQWRLNQWYELQRTSPGYSGEKANYYNSDTSQASRPSLRLP